MSSAAAAKRSPYLVSIVVSLAAFMEVLDTTIANVAIAHIAGSLGAGSEESTWVLTSYLVANGIVLPLSGWLSSLLGRKKFFLCCILGFTLTSFLCGIAASLPMLIVFRLLQGITGGGLQPSQQAIIKDSFPPEKLGMAFAITGITAILAPILGPVLGGYITDNYSWRWIFFMNVPIGLAAAFLVQLLVEDPPTARKQEVGKVDYIGLGLISLGLGALQIVMDKGQQEDWFDSAFIVFFSCLAAAGLILSVWWLLRQEKPIVDLHLLRIPSFALPCLMLFFVGFGLYATAVLMPMLVQGNFGYTATLSGMVLSPGGIVVIFMMPVMGRLVKVVQAKYLIAVGMTLCALGAWASGFLTPQTDYPTFVLIRILQTMGLPFLFVPASTLAFSQISPKDSSNASAIVSLVRNLGGSIGIALVTNHLIHSQQVQQANLAQHLTMADAGYRQTLAAYTQTIMNGGVPYAQAASGAHGQIYKELIHQASILAFRDAYNFIAVILLVLGIVALFMPGNALHNNKSSVAVKGGSS